MNIDLNNYRAIINWRLGFANCPDATIVIKPEHYDYFGFDNRIWRQTPCQQYCYASFDNVLFHFIAARNTGILPRTAFMGFGGHEFRLKLIDGGEVVTNDAWSGNARDFTQRLELPLVLRDCSVLSSDDTETSPWAGFAIRNDVLRKLVEAEGFYMTPDGVISTDPIEPKKPEGPREYPGEMAFSIM